MMRDALATSIAMHWPEAEIALAVDFRTAWAAAVAAPALILCDLGMPGATPVDGIRQLRIVAPETALIVVTGNEDDGLLLAIFGLGIQGFIPKTSSGPVIEAAIRLVLAGGQYLPPQLVALAHGRTPKPATPNAMARLTERQIAVLRLITEGLSNKDIARRLGLSPATVKAHVAAISAALGTGSRTEAAFKARAAGLI
jgi:DNA-binding NarL/FixJ family response regulator